MKRIAGLVRPGGTLLTAALRRSRGYLVGGKTFPSPNVDENDMRARPGALLRRCGDHGVRLSPGRIQRLSSIVLHKPGVAGRTFKTRAPASPRHSA